MDRSRPSRTWQPPVYIVRLTKGRTDKGAVGPFAAEDDATRWARDVVTDTDWSFTIEPLVAPIAVPTRQPTRHLSLVR